MKGLTARLLIFNLLLVVFPIGAVLFLGTYETQLLESQERAMVQQGRLLASALIGDDLAEQAEAIFSRLGARTDARLRVVDIDGRLLADSASPPEDAVQSTESAEERSSIRSSVEGDQAEQASDEASPEQTFIYRLGALPARTIRRISGFIRPPDASAADAEYYSGKDVLDGPEIQAALEGRYGAATRISRGQVSVTLYSAIPIFREEDLVGAVLVSRSTLAILSDLYSLRADIASIFLVSIGAAVILSILLARTVTVPVGRLRDQAEGLLDERGKLLDRFEPLSGRDEVADLSRALHRLSSRLQERTDHMEDFMADLVHEMKNPVAGILSAVELAERSAQTEIKRFLDVITREGQRIRHLLDDLRELISVDVRLDRQEREPVKVGLLLKNLVAGYYRSEKAGVKLVLQDKSDGGAMVNADPDRLGQAVLNLLDNAVSFSPKDGKVDIRLEETPEKMVRISVLDRGPGIGVDDPEKIFVRWYTDRSEAEASDHTGLGLAIVKGIAEGYNGRVAAHTREGGGSEFILEFPENVEK